MPGKGMGNVSLTLIRPYGIGKEELGQSMRAREVKYGVGGSKAA